MLTSLGQAKLSRDTLNTVGGVDVLDEGELPAGSSTLARGDGSGGEEVFPDLTELVRRITDEDYEEDIP